MKPIILAAIAALALAACAADGTFKSPADMTLAEKCDNAKLALAVAKANDVGADAIARIETNVALFCPAAE